MDSGPPANTPTPEKMSVISESNYEAALKMISEMSLTDKLRINADLATLMKKDGKTGSIGKAAKKEKKEKNPDAPKRAAAAGTLAWMAFVKHCKTEMTDRFQDCSREPERLSVCKAIKSEDEEAYKTFVEDFKKKHAESAESETAATPAPAPAPEPAVKMTADEKLAALKAKKAAEKTAAPAPAPAPAAKKPIKSAPAAKKEVKKAAPAVAPEPAEDDSPKKTIEGKTYFYDPETNGLWEMGGEGVLPWTWVGKFQEDEEEPILFCEQE